MSAKNLDDKACGCGISKIWLTTESDPLIRACLWHDTAYEADSVWQEFTRKEVDDLFLEQMLNLAEGKFLLRARAYLYYSLARLFGEKYWEGK